MVAVTPILKTSPVVTKYDGNPILTKDDCHTRLIVYSMQALPNIRASTFAYSETITDSASQSSARGLQALTSALPTVMTVFTET